MTAIARAVPRRGDGMTAVHNNNSPTQSRVQKNAAAVNRGKLKRSSDGNARRPRGSAQ
jgi:hypothetical protein